MSILSQVWQTEGAKEVRREPWITANLIRRRNRQDSMVYSLNNDHKIGHIPKPIAVNLENDSSSLYNHDIERSVNRRHGLIFPKYPSSNYGSRTRTRTWGSEDNSYHHHHHHHHDLANNSSRYRETIESVHPQSHISNSNDLFFFPSSFSGQLSRPSNILQSRNSFKKSAQQTPQNKNCLSNLSSSDFKPLSESQINTKNMTILMKTLGGRMRGEVELRINDGIPFRGFCHIDEVRGSLIYEGTEKELNFSTIMSDLRGSQVKPIQLADGGQKCLELINQSLETKIYLVPAVLMEFDLWLAVFLSWKNSHPPDNTPKRLTKSSSCGPENNRELRRLRSNHSYSSEPKIGNIIKVAKLLLWDPGNFSSKSNSPNLSTRELDLSSRPQWRRVSSILQDDGLFKLLTESDSTPLSIIQLSQLSRCSIQLIDRSVLGEAFCIAIIPLYAATTSQLSFFHPVYIASESRLMHEVWFCLLRAFTVPEIYGQWPSSFDYKNGRSNDFSSNPSNENVFRIEKSVRLRIVEARFSNKPHSKSRTSQMGKSNKDDADIQNGDYFVEVVLNGETRARTNMRNDPRNLVWREEYEFHNLPPQPSNLEIIIKKNINVADHSFLSLPSRVSSSTTDTIRWKIEIPNPCLDRGTEKETWWPILDQQNERAGELLMSVIYEETVVFLANHYQPISELLHNFSNGLTKQISQFLPSNLKLVSEIMMNIFQASGHAGDWLTTLVEDEIDGLEKEIPMDCGIRWIKQLDSDEFKFFTVSDRKQSLRDMGKTLQEEANLLFRGNSLLTQALDSHMRRVGNEYLKEVLSEKISEINLMNLDCEVDPSRILNNQDIQKNWNLLFSLTTDIWKSISSSAERCPPELRQIFKYIRAVAEDRYGNFLRIVPYTSVSGFLFLRFFCPALINPKLFGLLGDNPQPKAQRTLTLIAKALQVLANLSNFGKKESWMEPMNRFLVTHRQGMKNFIETLCSISTEQNASVTPASYSTPLTIFGRLPSISKEGFPSLPYLIDSAKEFSKLVKIWTEAASKNPEIDNLQGELFEFHQLCQQLKARAEECILKIEQFDKKLNDQAQNTSDSLKNNPNENLVHQPLSLHKLLCVDMSASSRNYQSAMSKSMEFEIGDRNFNMGSESKDPTSSGGSISRESQIRMDASKINTSFGQNREEWPLRGFLGDAPRK